MDSFESLITTILEEEGFWTQTSVKLKLTPSVRKVIGPTDPRPEIDIVAYRGGSNELWLVECKSFLDSGGVNISAFNGKNPKFGKKFKIFTDERYFEVIRDALIMQFLENKMVRKNPRVRLMLAAGHIAKESKAELKKQFDKRGWLLWDDEILKQHLTKLAKKGYDNSIATMVVKLLKPQ